MRALGILVLSWGLLACGPSGSEGADAGDPVDTRDEDGDGISDTDEGREEGVDTDDDGQPDYLDDDSDGDGIGDKLEAGDPDPATGPVDSDSDSVPDFRDLDSDDNAIDDGVATDSTDDLDGDGIGNWADLDDDGDGLSDATEIGDAPGPPDSDGDGIVDMHDLDSDADTILDRHELLADPDGDELPAYLDDDSDDDCRTDAIEAGDSNLDTAPIDSDGDLAADFIDRDSDDDGLADGSEDANCDGVKDASESAADDPDSDADGVSDLIETAAGTDANDAADNPQANGDFVFVVPYEEPPSPSEDDLDFSTSLELVDLYVLIDLSGTMQAEIASIRDNMQTVISNLTCPPLGTGTPGDCIPDIWSGIGSFTYAGRDAYVDRLRLQPNPALFSAAVPGIDNGACPPVGGCDESALLATWAATTGGAAADTICTPADDFPAAPSCVGSDAGAGGIGAPCFRPNALPIILLATDEAPSETFECPGVATAGAAANAIGAKVIGIVGDSLNDALVTSDLEALAVATGTIDGGGTPLVFAGADASAATAIENAVRTVANNVPIDVAATATDDAGDAVDAVGAFVDRLETLQLGTAACADGLLDEDSNGDGYGDLYLDLLPGTPVCWKLVARSNTTVPPTDEPQLFRATVEVFGGVTLLDTRDVYFLVPPDLSGPVVD